MRITNLTGAGAAMLAAGVFSGILMASAQAEVIVDMSAIGGSAGPTQSFNLPSGDCSQISNAPHRQLPFNTRSGPVIVNCDNSLVLPRTAVGQPGFTGRSSGSGNRIVLRKPSAKPVLTPPTRKVAARTVPTQPTQTRPVLTRPTTPKPAVTQPVVTRPAVTRPVVTRPAQPAALPKAPAKVEAPARAVTRPNTSTALQPTPQPVQPVTQPVAQPVTRPVATPAPEPKPVATPAPAPKPTQVAVATPAALPAGVQRIEFPGGDTAVSARGVGLLESIAASIRDTNQRVEVEAYADSATETNVWKRRVSLRRAQAVRSILLEKGVESFRILVRAMGPPSPDDSGPGNRVDIRVKAR